MDIVNNPYHDQKLYFAYHKEKAITLLQGKIPSPSLIEIDATDEGCNQACIHCCFGSSPHRKVRSINVEELLSFLFDAYKYGTFAYELVGGGEPTNHRKIADIIQGIGSFSKFGDEVPRIGLVTNGVRLDRIFQVAEHFDWVRISLDAPDAAMYNHLHGVRKELNHLGKVIENIKTLINLIGHKRVRLGYLVVPPYNHKKEEIFEAAALAADLGVEHIAFRPAVLNYPVDNESWKVSVNAILEVKEKYRKGFILGGTGGSWDYMTRKYNQPSGTCQTRPLVMVIKADGTIPTCFLYRDKLNERPPIGHISQGFESVWFSEAHQKSLEMVNRQECPNACKLFRADKALSTLKEAWDSKDKLPDISPEELDNPFFI